MPGRILLLFSWSLSSKSWSFFLARFALLLLSLVPRQVIWHQTLCYLSYREWNLSPHLLWAYQLLALFSHVLSLMGGHWARLILGCISASSIWRVGLPSRHRSSPQIFRSSVKLSLKSHNRTSPSHYGLRFILLVPYYQNKPLSPPIWPLSVIETMPEP